MLHNVCRGSRTCPKPSTAWLHHNFNKRYIQNGVHAEPSEDSLLNSSGSLFALFLFISDTIIRLVQNSRNIEYIDTFAN